MEKKPTSEDYAKKIMEIAYHDFPLVHPKETVCKVINALLLEFHQSEADREIERLKERIKLLQYQLENQEHYNELLVSELNELKGLTAS